MHYDRTLDIHSLAKKKSLFLFGPRSTGKSTLLKLNFSSECYINLLKSEVYLKLSAQPSLLREMVEVISKKYSIVVIDEIQKLPILLDEIHFLIEEKSIHFILTGSSARKLKRTGVNLLAGRAWQCSFFPLTSFEISEFNLERYLIYGGLPQVYTSSDPIEELDSYINTYLKEEIKEEALAQNFIHFSKFLKFAAHCNTQQINYSSLASDSGLPASTVKNYFEVLSDTFIGFTLEPWKESKKRKSISTGKFYFFDLGVANYLSGIHELPRDSDSFGRAFEHFIAMELRAYLSYSRIKKDLYFWRTQNKDEVDFIIGNAVAIEVKSTQNVQDRHLKSLRLLKEENIINSFYLISFDQVERTTGDGIQVLYWKTFLKHMYEKKILD